MLYIGRILAKLVADGALVKLGYGLYAKARKSSLTGAPVPVKGLPELAREALTKIGVEVRPSAAEQAYNSGKSRQVPTGRVIGVKGRVSRKIGFGGNYASEDFRLELRKSRVNPRSFEASVAAYGPEFRRRDSFGQ